MSLIDVESVPRRTMTLFFMADTSGSMAGNKIGALNDAITNILPMISEISNTNPDAEIKIAALQFSSGTSWLYDEPKNAEDFVWQEQKASGLTSLGEACCELEKVMHRNGFMKSASGTTGSRQPSKSPSPSETTPTRMSSRNSQATSKLSSKFTTSKRSSKSSASWPSLPHKSEVRALLPPTPPSKTKWWRKSNSKSKTSMEPTLLPTRHRLPTTIGIKSEQFF